MKTKKLLLLFCLAVTLACVCNYQAQAQPVYAGQISPDSTDRGWHEVDGVIYITFSSDSAVGKGWLKRLESKGETVTKYAKDLISSPGFKSTKGVKEIAILRSSLFRDGERTYEHILDAARSGKFTGGRKLLNPDAEIACFIREKFSDEELREMGLEWVIVFHKPLKDPKKNNPNLLVVNSKIGEVAGYWVFSGGQWGGRNDGFAFKLSPQ